MTYCKDHTRVELENGKCWACGDTEWKDAKRVLKRDMSILKQFSILLVAPIVGLFIFSIVMLVTS